MESTNSHQQILNHEFMQRKHKNASYSIRAFARDLNIGSTSLSDVLASKRLLSKKNVEKIAEKLSLSPLTKESMLDEYKSRSKKSIKELEYLQLKEDTFKLISDWYYLAILNLAKIHDNSAEVSWIASRLAISELLAKSAIERLIRLELLTIENNKLVRTANPITTTKNIPSSAIRKFHKDNLNLAEKAIDNIAVEKRSFGTTVMAVNPNKIEEVKDIINNAMDKIENTFEGQDCTEVYTFNFQLFPLTN